MRMSSYGTYKQLLLQSKSKELQTTCVNMRREDCCTVRPVDSLLPTEKNTHISTVCTSLACTHTYTHTQGGTASERKISVELWGYLWWDHVLFTQWWVHNPSIYTLFKRTPHPSALLQVDTLNVHRRNTLVYQFDQICLFLPHSQPPSQTSLLTDWTSVCTC